MAEKVGGIFYECTLDTAKMVEGQRRVDASLKKTTGSLDTFGSRLSQVAGAVQVLAAAMALVKFAQVSDDVRLLAARVQVAAGSLIAGAEAMRDLTAMSRRTQTSIEANAQVFTRLNSTVLQLGGTQRDSIRLTELLGKAIKVSGASAQESSAAMLQFGQALGSGKLQGDELRSLLENAPYLMKQLADGIGVPVSKLRELGEQGKLTSDVVLTALGKAAEKIEGDFQKLPQTFMAAFQTAEDAAASAAKALDDFVGVSAVLTGVAKGVAEVLDAVATKLGFLSGESTDLARNDAIKTWADATITVLSYVADAVDFTTRNLVALGKSIAAAAATAQALWDGNPAGAIAITKASQEELQKIREPMLAGKALRQQREALAGGDGYANSIDKQAQAKPVLKGGGGGGGGTKGSKFDSAGYLAGLRASTLEGIAAIDAAEAESKRKNDVLWAAKKLSAKEHAEAVTLIEAQAAQDRDKIYADEFDKEIERNAEERADRQQRADDYAEADKKAAADNERLNKEAAQRAADIKAVANPLAALQDEYEARLELVTQYEQAMAKAGVDATEQGQIARTQITGEYERQRQALAEQAFIAQSAGNEFLMNSLSSFANTASNAIVGLIDGTLTAQDAMRGLATTVLNEAVSALVQIGLQTIKNAIVSQTVEKAMMAGKAANAALYTTAIAAQVGVTTALAAQNAFMATAAIPVVGPVLAPAAAAAAGGIAAGLGAPAVAAAPVAGMRQYGGGAEAGSMYRVGESNRPEMFMGSSGKAFMIPGERGKVLSNSDLQGSGGWTVNVYNAPPGTTATVNNESRIIEVAVARAVAEVNGSISSNSGSTWNSLRGASSIGPRM